MNDNYNDNDYNNQNNNNNMNSNNLVYHYTENNYENKEVPYNTLYSPSDYSHNEKKKNVLGIVIPIMCVVLIASLVGLYLFIVSNNIKKERTFMIYMVGSDLESKSSQGTYSLEDIIGSNVDLNDNNVVLMVGGAEKWHNDFVDPDEIGIYSLTRNGFKKQKSLPLQNMGASDTLLTFLNYVYNNYKSDKYDMIFWNHGLGAIGIEQDELSKDFLTISELDNAFKNSKFSDNKLELTIFYNCLASNIHIANIMKNYSDYMVASEEIFYLSKVLNRLNFLEEVEVDDTAYDIGKLFIDQSDKVVTAYNETHTKKIDSTLSIIDLSRIDSLNNKLNNFIKTLDIKKNYYSISYTRKSAHTYGINQTYDYDTVDLYNLVEALSNYSSNEQLAKDVLNEINNTIQYTSNFNNYSKGISVYFPYYGSETSIQTHLSLFEKVFNDDYFNFINNFYQVRSGTKRARREGNNQVNKLSNRVVKKQDGSLSITLTEEEKKNYQDANIYLFSKKDNRYELLLESNKLNLKNNELVFSNNKLLKINNKIVSYIDKDSTIVYGKIKDEDNEMNVKYSIGSNNIEEVILDSDNYISSSLLELDDYDKLSFNTISYELFENGLLNEDFKETIEKDSIDINKNDMKISLDNNTNSSYYVLIEMKDIYNDSYYSELEMISENLVE